MEKYKITDKQTGKSVVVSGDSPPTEQEMEQIFSTAGLRNVPTTSERSWADVPGEAFRNAPSNAWDYVKGLAGAVTSPVETGKTVFNLFRGMTPMGLLQTPESQAFVGQMVKDYGSVEGFKEKLATRPIDFLADVSTLAGGVGGAAKAGSLGRIAQVAGTVEKFTDPLTLATLPLRGVARVAREASGVASGLGSEGVKIATEGRPTFTKAMRSPEEVGGAVVHNIETGFEKLRGERATKYQQAVTDLGKTHGNTVLDFAPVESAYKDALGKYRVPVDPMTGAAKLDDTSLIKSTIDKSSYTDLQRIDEVIQAWKDDPSQHNLAGFDTLKRKLDDFHSESKNVSAIASRLRNVVKDELIRKIPGYKTMVNDYADASKILEEMESAMGNPNKKKANAILNRTIQALKPNNALSKHLVEMMEESAGVDILGGTVGTMAKPLAPAGSMGRVIAGTSFLGGGIAAGAGMGLPGIGAMGALLLMASPRFVGEFADAYGKVKRTMQKFGPPALARNITYETTKADATKQKPNWLP